MTGRSALLMLDYQVALCSAGPKCRAPALAEQVAERRVLKTADQVLQSARATSWPVLHARLAFEPSYMLRTNRLPRFDPYEDQHSMLADSPEAQFVEPLVPVAGEPVVNKGCVDPFVGTPLLSALHAEGISELVMGGVATNLVVESAARHASDAGFQVTVIEDMCASFQSEFHEFSVTNMLPLFGAVITSSELLGRT